MPVLPAEVTGLKTGHYGGFSAECYSSGMKNLARRENLTSQLAFLLLFFPALALCTGAYPAHQGAAYQKVAKVDGIEYRAAEAVADEAFKRAEFVVQQMTAESPKIREKMAAIGFVVEIIGRDQVLSDLPDYAYLKGKKTRDGRDFDTGTRGLGGPRMCSVGEENLLCLRPQHYWEEDVFVYEFSHSMMDQMDPDRLQEIEAAYKNAVDQGLYPKGIYMVANSGEYWAEGVQAWLGVTQRTDVNGGFKTQRKSRITTGHWRRYWRRFMGQCSCNMFRVACTEPIQNRRAGTACRAPTVECIFGLAQKDGEMN
jgi:hypothetical protein